jgi:hypothetical protein
MLSKTAGKPLEWEGDKSPIDGEEVLLLEEFFDHQKSGHIKVHPKIKETLIRLEFGLWNYKVKIDNLKKKGKRLKKEEKDRLKMLQKGYVGLDNPWTNEWIIGLDGSAYFGQYRKDENGEVIQEGEGVKFDAYGIFL